MSKENVLHFLTKAARDEQLITQLQKASTQDELVGVADEAGYNFSSEHVDQALKDLKNNQAFLAHSLKLFFVSLALLKTTIPRPEYSLLAVILAKATSAYIKRVDAIAAFFS